MNKYIIIALLLVNQLAQGATITVDTNTIAASDGVCDLHDAINAANTDLSVDTCEAGSGADTIVLGVNTAITNPLPDITSTITMLRGGSTPIVQGNPGYVGRIFNITPSGVLTLNGVSVREGDVVGNGGCILNAGSLTLTSSSQIQNCDATGNGAGIFNTGTIAITSSRLLSNNAGGNGGGLYLDTGTNLTTFTNNEVNNNTATNGGGLYVFDGNNMTIATSGFNGNSATGNGGGIYASSVVNLQQSSLTNNSSGFYTEATLNAHNSTFSQNSGYGIDYRPTQNVHNLILRNVTVKNNTGTGVNIPTVVGASAFFNVAFDNNGPNCFSVDNTQGNNNISDDGSCPNSAVSGSIALGTLTGAGTTLYHIPAAGSSLIDAADNAVCASAQVNNQDQRFASRPEPGGTVCDVGAIENPDGVVFFNSIDLLKGGAFNDESGDGFAQAGETISYNFTVENTGDQTLTNITITDPLVAVPGNLPSLASGAIDNSTFTANYVLLQADVDAGAVYNVATVSGTDPAAQVVTDDSNNGVPFEIILPVTNSIDLVKTGLFNDESGDGFAQVGETITYSFAITNTGSQELDNVYVDDPLLFLPVGFDDLLPGQTDNSTIFGDYTLVQADIDAGEVINLATAFGTTPSKNEVSDQSNDGVPLVTPLNVGNSIDLIKGGVFNDESGDGFAQVGETISYNFTVGNTGAQALTNVSIADPLTPVSGFLPNMAPGAVDSTTFTASYALVQADIDAGQVSNIATVSGTTSGGGTVTDQSNNGVPFVITLNINNSIDLLKSGVFNDENGDGFAQLGETISYSFVVENTGSQNLTNVSIADPLTPVSGLVANMAPGAVDSTTFTATYALDQGDLNAEQVSNIATVSGTTPGGSTVTDQSNNGQPFIITLNVGNEIDLLKGGVFNDESGDGFAQVGETISYNFTVENTGSQNLINITIADPLTPVSGFLTRMAPGDLDSTTFTANYVLIQADIDAEQVSNIATVSGTTPGGGTVTDQSNNGVPFIINLNVGNSIELIKSGVFNDESGDGFAQVGETISYSFSVQNTGAQTLSNLSIADPLTPVSGNLATLAPGAIDTGTFTATYALTQSDIDVEQVSNTATVTGSTPTGGTVMAQSNNGQPLITPLNINNSIDLLKSGVFNDESGDGLAQAGETVSFSFVVENTGAQSLMNVSINDPLTPVVGNLATMGPGVSDSTTFSASYTLVQADVDAGEVTNIATVTGTTLGGGTVTDQSNDGVLLRVNLPGDASIDLTKGGSFNDESGDGFAQAGETISYNFIVENTGVQTLTNVFITDPLTPVSGNLASMASGAVDSTTFTAQYTLLQSDVDAGFVDNTATVFGTDPMTNQVSALSNNGLPFRVDLPSVNSIDLIKGGVFNDESGDGFAQAGETISYSFTVENTGSETLSNVSIDDPLTPVAGNLATMAAGQVDTTTFSASYALSQADVDARQVSNIATVTGTTNTANTVTDQSNDGQAFIVDLDVFNGIALIKEGSYNDLNQDGSPQVGETITYRFTVMNNGDQTLSDIIIEDPLVDVPGVLTSLAPGEENSGFFRANYSITANDIQAGVVTNIATVYGFDPQGNMVSDQSNNGVPLDTQIGEPPTGPQGPHRVPVDNPFALVIMALIMGFLMRNKMAARV